MKPAQLIFLLLFSAAAAACQFGDNDTGRAISQTCGDGQVDPLEECDDGNLVGGDGCSRDCAIEATARCELVPQSGCAAGQACDLADDGSMTECRPIGFGDETDTCDRPVDCQPGYTCVESASDASCMQFCEPGTCVGPGSECVIAIFDGGNAVPGVSVCSQSCDPLDGSGCPGDWACRTERVGDDLQFTSCTPSGTKQVNELCDDSIECIVGTRCTLFNDSRRCQQICEVVGDVGCSDFDTCLPISNPIVIDGLEYGVCL